MSLIKNFMFDNLNNKNDIVGDRLVKPELKSAGQPLNNENNQKARLGAANLSNRPVEDIFSETDKNADREKPGLFKLKALESQGLKNDYKERNVLEKENVKKIIIFAIMIVGLLAGVLIIFWGLSKLSFISPLQKNEDSYNINKAEDDNQAIGGESNYDTVENTAEEPKSEKNKLLDTDGDGLTDEEEKELGIDINSVDTDDDGLFDREEVKVYQTDPLNADTDGDGYLDGEEIKAGNNPKGEGKLLKLPINKEVGDGLNEVGDDYTGQKDTDGDGLLDSEEEGFGTDILKIDTDIDGLSDYEEVKTYQTDPLKADTDGDGYLDGEEIKNGYNPKQA